MIKNLATAIADVNSTYSQPTTLKDKLRAAIMLHADKDGFLNDTTPSEVFESVWEAVEQEVMEFFVKGNHA